jgi:hypothetical protein
MIIPDRTFANFVNLSKRKFYHPVSNVLFKVSSCNWQANNDVNVLRKGLGTCYKVIITDKNDEVVEVHSSLMTGIVQKIQLM